jgi:hypothetical protein
MPQFYFHIVDGNFSIDPEGVDLPDMAAVRAEAIASAGSILRDAGLDGWVGEEWQMHVVNEAKVTVLKLTFAAIQYA